MRMASCPKCGSHNVNNFKYGGKKYWASKCYNCGFTEKGDYTARKFARYAWNKTYEKLTNTILPDEMCGRNNG